MIKINEVVLKYIDQRDIIMKHPASYYSVLESLHINSNMCYVHVLFRKSTTMLLGV